MFPIELVLRVPKEQTLVYDRIVHIKTSGNVKMLFLTSSMLIFKHFTVLSNVLFQETVYHQDECGILPPKL